MTLYVGKAFRSNKNQNIVQCSCDVKICLLAEESSETFQLGFYGIS